MTLPKNIDEVLAALDDIIELSIEDDSYLAVFAYVYRRTTAQIKTEIERGHFEDNERMHRMDVAFANLFIGAFHDQRSGRKVSRAWKLPFDNAHKRHTLIQHLLLGMNAHINLDLAIAASSIMRGKDVADLANDFRLINEILASITNEMQERLSRVSPLLFLLDWIGQRSDEKLADFSIAAAREYSWNITRELWSLDPQAREIRIKEIDNSVTSFGTRFIDTRSRLLGFILSVIKKFESSDKRTVLGAMRH